MPDYVFGVDIGGTFIKAGIVDFKGTILAKERVPTEAKLGSKQIIDKIETLVTKLKKDVPDGNFKAAGFGVPGAIRSREGVVTQAPNIPALDGVSFRSEIESRLKIPCYIDNDANLAAAGEMWVGAGKGYEHICALTLGTGIGG